MFTVREKINYCIAPYVWEKKNARRLNILWQEVKKPFYDHIPQLSKPTIVESFVADNKKWEHIAYVKEVKGKFFIDPKSGFLIDEDNKIIKESIVFDHYGAYPEFLLRQKKKTIALPEVILFDHYWARNYFHFYSDVLHKLFLLDDFPQLKNIPLIVSEAISNTKTFRFFLQFPEIASFNWHIQKPNEIIATEKAYLLQPMPYDSAHWERTRSIARSHLRTYDADKKIFINRPHKTGRSIANFEVIRPILLHEGFKIITLEDKSVEEQIAIFSSAAVVASIHGAAMANIMYCDKRCKILEIMPDKLISTHYYWLSHILGLPYDSLLGGKLEINRLLYPKGRFYLDPIQTKNFFSRTK